MIYFGGFVVVSLVDDDFSAILDVVIDPLGICNAQMNATV
ncbi:hypothetical protein SN35N_2011 [Lactiplantibacillus plantarum]|nr:hypothetical protein SN35N_2011 [Lactiplantibacillus plantarum]